MDSRNSRCFTLLTCLLLFAGTISTVQGQKLCDFVTSRNISTSKSSSTFINNFSTNKCLRIEQLGHFANSKVMLDECFWGKTGITHDENYYLLNSSLASDGVTIRSNAGIKENYCLSTKSSILATVQCDPASWDQVWRIKPVRGNENNFLIQQASSSYCLVPRERSSRSLILLAPCNAYQTEQIWKICMTFQLRA